MLISGEKNRQQVERTTITTTAVGKAWLTEKPTVYVNSLDFDVTMMVLEDSPAVLSLSLFCEEMGYFCA